MTIAQYAVELRDTLLDAVDQADVVATAFAAADTTDCPPETIELLRRLIVQRARGDAQLREENQRLRDEIAALKRRGN